MRCFTNLNQKPKIKYQIQKRASFWFFVLGTWLVSLPLSACPLCKEAISAVKGLADGFYWGILLMLMAPFFAVAVIVTLVVRAQKHPSKQPHL